MTYECYARTTRYLLPCSDTHFSGRGAGAGALRITKIFVSFCHVHTPCLQFSCSAFLFAYWAAAMKGGFEHLRRAFWSHISNGAWEGRGGDLFMIFFVWWGDGG